jgi:hypothetical protein
MNSFALVVRRPCDREEVRRRLLVVHVLLLVALLWNTPSGLLRLMRVLESLCDELWMVENDALTD